MFVQKASLKHNLFILSVVNMLILLSFISINQGNKYLFKAYFSQNCFYHKKGIKQPKCYDGEISYELRVVRCK